ncbi:hypothetical protein IFM89_020942 [Coptis chinensis]|uniref:cyclin-dependent kinase n=1 Tax=Coptis chinensis TaxID=261450 RepID=A0A835M0W9_9MAGN|nr:hypothetical protein IFM89_020942 [Coptis chinensis]
MSYCPVLKLSKTLGFANAPKLMNMNLTAYIMKFEIECPDMVKVFMKQLLAGLAHIHDQRGMHRNIKASNILVDTDSTPHRVKIADFGSAKILLNLNLSPLVGTGAYKAPELLLGVVDYGTPADIWALGCIFGEMANWNCLPIFVKNDRTEEVLLDTFPTLGEVGVDLLSRMLCLNPGNRITAVEALNHPYFSSLLGSHTETSWPGVILWKFYPSYLLRYFDGQVLLDKFPTLGEVGVDLLSRMLCLNLGNRITAEVAPNHPYFNGCESGISIFTRILPQSWYPNHCRSSSESSIFQRVCESGIGIFTHAHCLNLGLTASSEQSTVSTTTETASHELKEFGALF